MNLKIESRWQIAALLLFYLTLSACAAPAATLPSAATFTITPKPSVSARTAPPQPSKTPQPSPTFVQTELTQSAEFAIQCANPGQSQSISPDKNWLAVSCGEDNPDLEIVSLNSGKRWMLSFTDYIWNPETPGGLYPQVWSGDSQYLYFTSAIAMGGGGGCFYGTGPQGLYRMNVSSGVVSAVLPMSKMIQQYTFAISPTGRRLAYKGLDNPVILDLQSGDETTLKVGKDIIGDFTWSPDGLELAYSVCQENADDSQVHWSAIKLFSVEENDSRTLLALDNHFLTIYRWHENTLEVNQRNEETYETTTLLFDLLSGQWLTATPAP